MTGYHLKNKHRFPFPRNHWGQKISWSKRNPTNHKHLKVKPLTFDLRLLIHPSSFVSFIAWPIWISIHPHRAFSWMPFHLSSLQVDTPHFSHNVGRQCIGGMMSLDQRISSQQVAKVCKLFVSKRFCSNVRDHVHCRDVFCNNLTILNLIPAGQHPPFNMPWLIWQWAAVHRDHDCRFIVLINRCRSILAQVHFLHHIPETNHFVRWNREFDYLIMTGAACRQRVLLCWHRHRGSIHHAGIRSIRPWERMPRVSMTGENIDSMRVQSLWIDQPCMPCRIAVFE